MEKGSKSVGLEKKDAMNRASREWESDRLLLEFGKSVHPHLRG